MAEYGDARFAAKTWHDCRACFSFSPSCLLGLACVHSLLAGEMIWNPFRRKKVVVKMNKAQ